jgi:hypothetical protein
MIRGRIVTFKHFLTSWTFSLQPAYITWDRPSNINSWVRFERLRLVLEDKSKVDEQRKTLRPVAKVTPPLSPPPPSPPPSPPMIGDESESDGSGLAPRHAIVVAAVYPAIGDESESDDGGRPLRAAITTAPAYLGIGDESDSDDRRPTARAPPAAGDDADDDGSGPQPPLALVGQKRPREAVDADQASEQEESPLPGAVGELLPDDDDDDELGSDDDDNNEEVEAMLDETTFADAPCVLAQYSKPVHKKDSYKFDIHLGVLTEGSRIHVFRDGKVELDFVDSSTFDAKLRQLRMLE